MDATSSVQVLIAVAALTIAMIAITRMIGLAAATHHAALPSLPTATPAGPDVHLLVAILTAAAAEMLNTGTDDLVVHSISELSDIPGQHWPRRGRFQRHHGGPETHF